MAVHRTDPVCNLDPSAATTAPFVDTSQVTVAVTDEAHFSVGCTIKIGAEEMRIDAATPPNPPGQPDPTITVVRNYNDTTAATHAAGPVTVGQDSARVTRGMYGSNATSHASGPAVAVNELTAEANTVRFKRVSGIGIHDPGDSVIDVDGLGGYQVSLSTNAATTAATVGQQLIPNGSQTTFDVTNAGALQPNWVILVNSEKMRVVTVNTGLGEVTVQRAVHGTTLGSHAPDTVIRGPIMVEWSYARDGAFLGSTGRSIGCDNPGILTQGVTLLCETNLGPLGPTGTGELALVEFWGHQLLPATPQQPVTLTPVLVDISGNSIPFTTGNQKIKVVKCLDVNGNGIFNNSDIVLVQRAFFGLDPIVLATMDTNLDNNLTYGSDVVLQQRVFFFTFPGAAGGQMRCLPSGA
jgi:hypothetical protein